VPRTIPPLDSQLAAPCDPLPNPPQTPASYDDLQAWLQADVLVRYGICAARHRETVGAWPK
jgi:hypothetical protein